MSVWLCSASRVELQSGSWFEQRDNDLAHVLALEEVFHTECNLFKATQTTIVNLDNELAWCQGFNHLSHVLLEMAGIGRHEETRNGTRSGKKLKCVNLVTLNTLLRVISRNGTNDQQTSFRSQAANATLAFNAMVGVKFYNHNHHLLAQACLEEISTNTFKHNINSSGIFLSQDLCKVLLLIVDDTVTSHRLKKHNIVR